MGKLFPLQDEDFEDWINSLEIEKAAVICKTFVEKTPNQRDPSSNFSHEISECDSDLTNHS